MDNGPDVEKVRVAAQGLLEKAPSSRFDTASAISQWVISLGMFVGSLTSGGGLNPGIEGRALAPQGRRGRG
ncbi:MAG: hypothetical protein MZU91_15215 [Desulfosudis oleivorans]|nr:hypothetical protein [Desulfosudis oleivorans]